MSSRPTSPSRLSRIAAKEVPHRKADRFYAARSSLRARIEQLQHDVQHANLRDAARTDLLAAADRALQQLRSISEDTSGGRSLAVDLERHVGHLQDAEHWLCLGDRVLARMGTAAPEASAAVVEAQDVVLWHVRADQWNGQLMTAVGALIGAVQDAEARAARLVAQA